ncbi:MAG: inorganic phosphate transporter [Thermoleophilia bacterium]
MPVSTTHVVTSAVTGTGMASGLSNVGWKTFRDIILTWLITLPFLRGSGSGLLSRRRMRRDDPADRREAPGDPVAGVVVPGKVSGQRPPFCRESQS